MRASAVRFASKSKWTDLRNKHFETPPAPAQIDPSLLPRVKEGQTVYEPADFALKARGAAQMQAKMDALMNPPVKDVFRELKLDPLQLWKSPTLLSKFITQNGKIMPGFVNQLKSKSQRQVARAVRRCRAAGLLSPVHQAVFRENF